MATPGPNDWDTSTLPESRRAYLDKRRSFDSIAALIAVASEITKYWIERIDRAPSGCPDDFQRTCFRLRVSNEAFDLFYNAPDGLRGRYWQSPDIGLLATRHLINVLSAKLLAYVKTNRPVLEGKARKMTIDEVGASLKAPSAKVWVRDRNDLGSIISPDSEPALMVRRWVGNESTAPTGKSWRWTPCAGEIEVKGALIRDGGKEVHIPDIKRDRSCQIHRHGYT